MKVDVLSADDLLRHSRRELSLCVDAPSLIDDSFVAASLRRAAAIFCPCSRATLVSAVLESLEYLAQENATISLRIKEALESIVVVGDLLELGQVTIDDPSAKSTWVFAAPPGFVTRPDGSVFLIGIPPDGATLLPEALSERVVHEGFARVLRPQASEDLRLLLRDLELLELPERVWLKTPKREAAAAFLDGMLRRLANQPPAGTIEDLKILDPESDVRNYSRRWDTPGERSGAFIARRPQAYGAPQWGYVMLEMGDPVKFLDLPLRSSRWRGCDNAWHLQMALDSNRGNPQRYRHRISDGRSYLDFFSPIPLWAQRRLATLGRPAPREACLFSYWIPVSELATQEEFLQQHLWLAPVQ